MAFASRLLGSGTAPAAAINIVGDVATGLVATGTTQATALQLSAVRNLIATTASSTGVLIPADMNPGDECFIYNATGQSTLTIYPQLGESINAIATNGGFSLATNKAVIIVQVSNTQYATILTA